MTFMHEENCSRVQENTPERGGAIGRGVGIARCKEHCKERSKEHCWTIGFVGCCIGLVVAYVLHPMPFGII